MACTKYAYEIYIHIEQTKKKKKKIQYIILNKYNAL